MALTFTSILNERLNRGNLFHIYNVTFDNSYPAGGEAVTAANFGMTNIRWIIVNAETNVLAKWCDWDRTNSKLRLRSHTAELSGDQSGVTVQVAVIGL